MIAMFSQGYIVAEEDRALLVELAALIAVDEAFADYTSDDCKLLARRPGRRRNTNTQ